LIATKDSVLRFPTVSDCATVGGCVAASSVVKIWHEHGLAPHRWRSFKLSNDKAFAEKLHDVVGLYVSPPAHAIVLSVDDKSQIQALDRTRPGPGWQGIHDGPSTSSRYRAHGSMLSKASSQN
jgi:hypothetical protein